MHGQYGRILRINLSEKKYWTETPEEAIYDQYLGGKGLASYLLYKLNPPGVDPLHPDNCLIFATGPDCRQQNLGDLSLWCFHKVTSNGVLFGILLGR